MVSFLPVFYIQGKTKDGSRGRVDWVAIPPPPPHLGKFFNLSSWGKSSCFKASIEKRYQDIFEAYMTVDEVIKIIQTSRNNIDRDS